MKSIRQIKNFNGKKVLVRVDFNVPIKKGKTGSDYKLAKSLPTIEYLLKGGATVLLMSHLGRPKGKDNKYSLGPVAERLEELLQRKINLLPVAPIKDWKKTQEAVSSQASIIYGGCAGLSTRRPSSRWYQ